MKAQRFGRYLLLDRVASGGMAEVWRSKLEGEAGFSRIYAIKKILPHVAEDQEFITMFQDEANITVQLQHANIGQVFEFNKIDGIYYLAMEYISSKDLKTVWSYQRSRKTTIPLELACHIVQKMADGLDYAHRKKDNFGRDLGIVHRDVSPQNALLSWDGEVKVIDFGIAKAADKSGRTRAGTLKGKFAYMSPEQIRGLPLDGRADVFALGVVLYELVTGERGFQAESEFSLLEMVRNVEIKPPTLVNSNIPQELERIVFKALAKDREHRYQYASDLSEDLQRFLLMRGKPPSRHDLAEFLRTNFTVDHDKERTRLESYKDVQIEEDPADGGHFGAERSQSQVRAPSDRSRSQVRAPAPEEPPQPPSAFATQAAALDDMLNIDVSAETQLFDGEADSAFSSTQSGPPPRGRGSTNARGAPERTGPIRSSYVATREQLSDAADTTSGRTPTNIRPPVAPAAPMRGAAPVPAKRSSGVRVFAIAASLTLLIVGGAAVAAFMLLKPTGTIVVTVTGAQKGSVIVDGERRGDATPSLTVDRLASGTHSIVVEEPGFAAFSQNVEVLSGKVLNVKAPLRKAPGKLNIISEPPGAIIVLDDKETGDKTPATLEVEGDVLHHFSLKLDGYKPHTEAGVKVAGGEDKTVKAKLKPSKVKVRLFTFPEGATVKINGASIGASPVSYERAVDDGLNLRVDVAAKGCEPYTFTLPLDDEKPEQRFEVPPLKCK